MVWYHSTTACVELRKLTSKSVIQDVPTRWNSTYDMLTRFLELRSIINGFVNKNTTAPPMLSASGIWENEAVSPNRVPTETSSDSDSSPSGAPTSSLFKKHNKSIHKVWFKNQSSVSSLTPHSASSIHDQLSLYLKLPQERIQQNPVLFWKQMANSVSKVASKYVPAVATSVPSDRLFSQAGQILRNQRSRPTPDIANKLLSLKEVDDKYW